MKMLEKQLPGPRRQVCQNTCRTRRHNRLRFASRSAAAHLANFIHAFNRGTVLSEKERYQIEALYKVKYTGKGDRPTVGARQAYNRCRGGACPSRV